MTARTVKGILHFLTPQQMAEEIVRLDAALSAIEAAQGDSVHLASGTPEGVSGSDVPARPTSPAEVRDAWRGGNSYEASMLRNLLAVIHGDGGHYIEAHGLDKAIEDAESKVLDRFAASPPLPQEQGADTRDAARYRWWRVYAMQTEDVSSDDAFLDCVTPADVDAVIDAAMSPVADPGQAGKGETK